MGYYIFNKRLFYTIVTNLQVFFLKLVGNGVLPLTPQTAASRMIACQLFHSNSLPAIDQLIKIHLFYISNLK